MAFYQRRSWFTVVSGVPLLGSFRFYYTPRQRSDASGVIVSARSVCVCVSFSQVNRQTYGPEFRHVGQVGGYLGKVRISYIKVIGQRSRSTGQKSFLHIFLLQRNSAMSVHNNMTVIFPLFFFGLK